MLKLEIEGFHHFVRYVAGKDVPWGPVPKEDSCSLCQNDIGIGDEYTLIEITKEYQNTEEVRVLDVFPLAVLCESCAEKYMVWL